MGWRTPIGKFGGGLAGVRPDDLLAVAYRALIERTGIDPALLDDVFAGCGNQGGEDNRDVARMATLLAGFPVEVPGVTVNRNCSSALEAVNLAARSVVANEGDVYIGSGVESMSRAPGRSPNRTAPQPPRRQKCGTPRSAGGSTIPRWMRCIPSSASAKGPN